MRLGIFGGTFNPIHTGHLLLAETARDALRLDRVVFIPTRQPPHKPARGLLDGAQRLELIELAIRHHPAFAVSDIELQRPGPSYSIDTVRTLRSQLPGAKLFLLVGADMLGVRWAAWDELRRLCTVVAAARPGASPRKQRGVKWLPMPQVDIASSDIRQRLKAGRSIRYLVPPAVERYLRERGCYGGARKGGEAP
jgi:nicotinate-nucleotide adenylyltransferase